MMLVESDSGQSLPNLWNVSPQSAFRHLGKTVHVGDPVDQCSQHYSTRTSEDITEDGTELHVGIFEYLLNTVLLGRKCADQLPSPSREVPEVADFSWGNETAPHQS